MKNSNKNIAIQIFYLLLYLSMTSLSGCALTTEKWDGQFGSSTRQNMQQQIIDPLAGNKQNTGYAIDGRVAKEIITRYQNSYKDPAPESNNFTIGVGK
jgi:hypothetical protein